MLNLQAPICAHQEPYRWAVVQDLITPGAAQRLRDQLPPPQLLPRARRDAGGDKTYSMSVLPLLTRSQPLAMLDQVGPAWRELIQELTASDYRSWVHSVVGVDVADAQLDIGLFVFGPGDRISSHTDKVNKYATHVFYLNPVWEETHGGQFEVRTSADLADPPYATITPAGGRSVLFPRSESSWHAVAPVSERAPEHRLTFQVEMWS